MNRILCMSDMFSYSLLWDWLKTRYEFLCSKFEQRFVDLLWDCVKIRYEFLSRKLEQSFVDLLWECGNSWKYDIYFCVPNSNRALLICYESVEIRWNMTFIFVCKTRTKLPWFAIEIVWEIWMFDWVFIWVDNFLGTAKKHFFARA